MPAALYWALFVGFEGVHHDDGIEQTTGTVLTKEYTTWDCSRPNHKGSFPVKCELPKMDVEIITQSCKLA